MMRMKRAVCALLMSVLLLGTVVTLAPDASAVSGQMVTVEKDTLYRTSRNVTSDFKVSKGTLRLPGVTLTVNGDFYLEGGKVQLDGGTLNILGDLYVSSDLYVMYGKVNVAGNVIHTGGEIDVGMGKLIIGGDYHIAAPKEYSGVTYWDSCYGELLMQHTSATVTVGGDFYMDSCYGTDFTAGTLTVSGDFTQKSDFAPKKFSAEKTHKTILNGETAQTVTLESDKSTFAKLEITNPEGIIVPNYFAAASLTAPSGEVRIQSENAVFENVTLAVPQLTVIGNMTQHGDLTLQSHTMTVDGNLVHTDGDILVGWGTLNVTGDYHLATPGIALISIRADVGGEEAGEAVAVEPENDGWSGSHGKLIMNYAYSTVNVGGDFYVNASDGTAFTAGTLTVSGDFTQKVNYSLKRFVASGNHTVVLNGAQTQRVTLESPESTFAKLQVENPDGILVTDYLAAAALTAPDGAVKIRSEGAAFENLTLDTPLVTVTGDLVQDGKLELKNNTLKVEGNLIQTSGEIVVGMGELDVSGDYYIATPETDEAGETTWSGSFGVLTMGYSKGSVTVGGDFYAAFPDAVRHTAGTLTVMGERK